MFKKAIWENPLIIDWGIQVMCRMAGAFAREPRVTRNKEAAHFVRGGWVAVQGENGLGGLINILLFMVPQGSLQGYCHVPHHVTFSGEQVLTLNIWLNSSCSYALNGYRSRSMYFLTWVYPIFIPFKYFTYNYNFFSTYDLLLRKPGLTFVKRTS